MRRSLLSGEAEDRCAGQIMFPLFGDWEVEEMSRGLRAAMYVVGMFWFFVGVAIISDTFMSAIERITSSHKKVKVNVLGTTKEFHVRVWNDTVANLTLMALGSSAPEILLAVIEICVLNDFKSGDLGPSTIVGSAAFNLLMITAVCIYSIPSPEIRKIRDMGVYCWTATCSILAYVWLIIVMIASSPNKIEIWEAVVTFLCFPALVGTAYMIDMGYFERFNVHHKLGGMAGSKVVALEREATDQNGISELSHKDIEVTQEEIDIFREAGDNAGKKGMPDEEVRRILQQQKHRKHLFEAAAKEAAEGFDLDISEVTAKMEAIQAQRHFCPVRQAAKIAVLQMTEAHRHSRAYYRVKATRELVGGRKVVKVEEGDEDIAHDGKLHPHHSPHLHHSGHHLHHSGHHHETRTDVSHDVVIPFNERPDTNGDGNISKLRSDETAVTSVSTSPRTGKSQEVSPLSKNSAEADVSTINFACPLYAGIESDLIVVLEVERHASSVSALNCKESVRWSTQDDTAKSGVDYKGASGVVYFEPGKVSSTIEIELIKKEDFSADRRFRVLLHDPDAEKTLVRPHPAPLPGLRSAGVSGDDHFTYAEVVIINVDDPGILSFADERMRVNESAGHAVITVLRSEGCSGTVTCRYWTQDGTAVSPADYEATEGELIFLPGEMWKQFEVAIVEDEAYENDETFLVHITDATGGARFDATTDGSVESCICEVKIISDEKVIKATDRLMASLNINKDLIKRNYVAWGEQFVDALKVSDDDEFAEAEGEEVPKPSCGVYVMHFLSLPWKLVFALVPPTEFLSGWTCFFCSLIGIGCLTLVVGELASVIGCLLKIEDAITAITFVALGTSLPDTLASKAAAKADPYADASIGNVTGSNSVNVFLGLGLPWLIASIYWTAKGERSMTKEQMEELSIDIEDGVSKLDKFGESGFYVPSGNLTFSVVVFCCCGLTCIAFLQIRRMAFGGELGGPYVFKVLSSMFLVMLWFVYIVFSVLQIEGIAF